MITLTLDQSEIQAFGALPDATAMGAQCGQYFERLLHLWGDGWYEGKTAVSGLGVAREPGIF
jgi:hypothetical protein